MGLFGIVNPEWAAISLGLSGALVVAQYRMYRLNKSFRPPVIVVVIGLLLTTAAAFWWVSIYAQTVGKETAESIAHSSALPLAIVYSKNDLRILGHEPLEASALAEQPSWPFKYTGYKVLSYANDRWFLIPKNWEPSSPTVILPDDGSVRIELLQGR